MWSFTFLISASCSLWHLLIILLIQCLLFKAQYAWHSNLWGPDIIEYHCIWPCGSHNRVLHLKVNKVFTDAFVHFSNSVERRQKKICSRGSGVFQREHTNETELSLIVKSKLTLANTPTGQTFWFLCYSLECEIHYSWLGLTIVLGHGQM